MTSISAVSAGASASAASTSMKLRLNGRPHQWQKLEPPVEIYHCRKCDELRCRHLAMAEVKSPVFDRILEEK